MSGNNQRKFLGLKTGLVLLFAALLLPALLLLRPDSSSPMPEAAQEVPSLVRVSGALVERRPLIRQGFSASATLEARESVVLLSKVSGRLSEMRVSQGDGIKKGDVVAVLDHRDQDAQVSALQAQVNAAKAEAEQAGAQLENATKEKERYERLRKEGYAAQQELDSRIMTYQSARASYNRSLASVKQQEANLSAQKVSRSEYILLSPMDGVVLKDYSLTPGTMISEATSVAEIADVRIMKGVAQLSEMQASRVSVGMKVVLSGDGFPGAEVEGSVSRISPYVDTSTRTLQVEVVADNAASGGALKPGMFVSILFVEAEAVGALTIPSHALRQSGKVFVDTNGTAEERTVETGLTLPDAVQILSGLEEGERVVVGGKNLKGGEKVVVGE
ncbi:efflux RND transporter periplasmic adaptor subunit [Aminivibrio sp.]|uniref:efflux RND transporter periplasmic adaptor subunit n=1 Tax=Aminivibrio sp. TaxID=1872489 RepID=UPI001A447C27|nr:efflux RND transporter periplasmic adaptor subunit [Aminivibrio sp.]MBL3539134.1 efflux RND transporter periplasmic adaptor subunit [Aminivibrio sp.]